MLQDNKIDIWLKRIGYLSQIGTLIVMIITIFYTVIPLYRTAALEESIAKKESELKVLANKINEFERKERRLILASYVSSVSFYCTSLSQPILVPLPPNDINDFFKKRELTMLNQDIEGCIKKPEYVDSVINALSNNDKLIFKQELDIFVDKISKLRKEKIHEYLKVEKQLNNNEIVLELENDDDTPSIKLLDELARKAGVSEEDLNRGKKHSYLASLEAKFEDDIRQEIFKFSKIKWDDHE
ncbi:hypothetical protein JEP98_10550 [Providencia rettgeri]|uniref:hypothetical protein n=1 Tax=Providencia rettgeri TaxID=587 RepID=UPI0018E46DB3|nr:hypothetical protein [Providencia rettgeri]MBI6189596.1 hypothetical protein [Providencia rettgeri]